jgi:hypothetical protein
MTEKGKEAYQESKSKKVWQWTEECCVKAIAEIRKERVGNVSLGSGDSLSEGAKNMVGFWSKKVF